MSKNKKTIFRGAATALITPFKNGKIDYDTLGNLIDRQIDLGIDALVICGTTGENATLSDDEHRAVLDFSLKKAAGRVPMIAGTGSNNTSHAVDMSRYASSLGFDGLLVVTPYYNKATDNGLVAHFEKIAAASDAPIILYNVPSRTGCNISFNVYQRLSKRENIVALKEASGNLASVARIIAECGDDLDVYSGDDALTLPILSLGGTGVISVASNIIPSQMSDLCLKFFEGDILGSRALHQKYLKLFDAMFCEVNPIPVKTALSLMDLCLDDLRLPLYQISEINKQLLKKTLSEYALI